MSHNHKCPQECQDQCETFTYLCYVLINMFKEADDVCMAAKQFGDIIILETVTISYIIWNKK